MEGKVSHPLAPRFAWTAYDAANAGQERFVQILTDQFGFQVETVDPKSALTYLGPTEKESYADRTRFDPQISFALGRYAGRVPEIVVISDSYGLFTPMLEAERRGTRVHLSFFRESVDPRWQRHLDVRSKTISFLDLSEHLGSLYRLRVPQSRGESVLRLIP